jgi:type IV pilus assembly protein PilA
MPARPPGAPDPLETLDALDALDVPPAGGFGARLRPAAGPAARGFGFTSPPPAPRSGVARSLVTVLVTVAVSILMLGALGVLGMVGLRKYLGGAKSAEVRIVLGEVAKDAAAAYERRAPAVAGSSSGRVCPSASRPIPTDVSSIRGKAFASSRFEWEIDKPVDAGFACLGFELAQPQFYQYRYDATATSFVAVGRGDLDGDGRLSTFTLRGAVEAGRLVPAPSIEETDPDE